MKLELKKKSLQAFDSILFQLWYRHNFQIEIHSLQIVSNYENMFELFCKL